MSPYWLQTMKTPSKSMKRNWRSMIFHNRPDGKSHPRYFLIFFLEWPIDFFLNIDTLFIHFRLQEALAQISEYSEAGLTVRGTYVQQGKTVPEGERKLYLAIESCSEMSVQKAKREITRLIKEELLKLTHVHPVFNKGRYKVL